MFIARSVYGDALPGAAKGGVLSPELYNLLQLRFGHITLGNAGSEWCYRIIPGARGPELSILTHGEIYRFNCPYCNDIRHRGWVSYQLGQDDPLLHRPMTNLVGCFNETECFSQPGRRRDFLDRLLGVPGIANGRPLFPEPRPGSKAAAIRASGPVTMPGTVFPLDALPDNHVAVQYVKNRGFDPAQIARDYDVCYCSAADDLNRGCFHRLIIPIHEGGKLVGWQARALSPGAKPKYLNAVGPHTSRLLYNVDRGTAGNYVIIVEGPTAVWSVGERAVATLGAHVSPEKANHFAEMARRNPLAFLTIEPKAEPAAEKSRLKLEPFFKDRLVMVPMPTEVTEADCRCWPIDKVDPGNLTTAANYQLIAAAARAAGFDLAQFS